MSACSKKPFPVSISVDLDRPSSVTEESEWPNRRLRPTDDRQGGFPAAAAEHLGVRTHSLSSIGFESWSRGVVNYATFNCFHFCGAKFSQWACI